MCVLKLLCTCCVAEFTPCNRSLGVGICPLSFQCYDLWRTCDGTIDCVDGYDEITCKSQLVYSFGSIILNKLLRCTTALLPYE